MKTSSLVIVIIFVIILNLEVRSIEIDRVAKFATNTVVSNLNGTITYQINQASDSISYQIKTSYDIKSVLFVFQSFYINSAQIQIYDSNVGASGTPLFSCVSSDCGSLLPSPFSSNTGSVVVYFGGIQASKFVTSSFQLQYFCRFNTKVPTVESLTAYTIRLLMSYAKLQPFLIPVATNITAAAAYNNVQLLPAKSVTTWIINIPYSLTISVSNYFFGDKCSARLKIYSSLQPLTSSLIFSGCTNDDRPLQWLYSSSGQALIELRGGPVDQYLSFTVTYSGDNAEFNHCGSLSQPDIQYDDSMTISDGSKPTDIMRRSEKCSWSILPSPSTPGPVTLIFPWVSLKDGSSVMVYDSASATGRVLWRGVGPTVTTPPPLTSLAGNLYIVYTSNSLLAEGYFGFQGQYYRRGRTSQGMGNRREQLSMSSSLSIRPSWFDPSLSPAPRTSDTAVSGTLGHSWLINPKYSRGGVRMNLNLISLPTRSDRLIIQDGLTSESPLLFNMIGPYNGTSANWITSTTNAVRITLTTTLYNCTASTCGTSFSSKRKIPSASSGFDLSYYSDGSNYHCGFSNNPGNVTALSMTLSDGSSSLEHMQTSQNCLWIISPVLLTYSPSSSSSSVVSSAVSGGYGSLATATAGLRTSGVVVYFHRLDLTGGYSLSFYVGSTASQNLWLSISSTNAIPAPLVILTRDPIFIRYQSPASQATPGAPLGFGFLFSFFSLSSSSARPGDKTMYLHSSSALSVALPPLHSNLSLWDTTQNMTWVIRPFATNGTNSSSPIYLSFSHLYFPDCTAQYLLISDGTATTRYCASPNTPATRSPSYPSWLIALPTSLGKSGSFTVKYISMRPKTTTLTRRVGFELSYFTDGPNFHCGFSQNPGWIRAPSMVLTDGSDSFSSMYDDQRCDWHLSPSVDFNISSISAGTDSRPLVKIVVLEFFICDLIGATIRIFDGSDGNGKLLFNCNNCTTPAFRLLAFSGEVFIQFTTTSPSQPKGDGFKLVYWTLLVSPLSPFYTSLAYRSDISNSTTSIFDDLKRANDSVSTSYLLEVPADSHFARIPTTTPSSYQDPLISLDKDNSTKATTYISSAFRLVATSARNSLDYLPFLSTPQTANDVLLGRMGVLAMDGRPNTKSLFLADATSTPIQKTSCGVTTGPSYFITPTLTRANTFHRDAYQFSNMKQKAFLSIHQRWNRTTSAQDSSLFRIVPAGVCSYEVRSSTPYQAVDLRIRRFLGSQGASLFVYGGGYHHNTLLFSTELRDVANVNLQLPCGLGVVVLQYYNGSLLTKDPTVVSYGLTLDYYEVPTDKGNICAAYLAALGRKKGVMTNPMIYIIISVTCVVLVVAFAYYVYQSTRKKDIDPAKLRIARYKEAVVTDHPRYRPYYDGLRNLFLFRGSCCICKEGPVRVYKLSCKHSLCVEDMTAYLGSGLQDISKFPLKCPMHYEGCDSVITPIMARRFLTAANYARFLDFTDRATLGEGFRCIFCASYVNFQADGKKLMVECPHCVRRFCMRCRKPWHYTSKCPMEAADDLELQNWKAGSGAQKCPTCGKLIEKEDPDTCNHMVHKITDSIPCIRNRTDFCYLCGLEVTGEYPHEEAARPGVNHFPKGVFQFCLTVIEGETREPLKRASSKRRLRPREVNTNLRGIPNVTRSPARAVVRNPVQPPTTPPASIPSDASVTPALLTVQDIEDDPENNRRLSLQSFTNVAEDIMFDVTAVVESVSRRNASTRPSRSRKATSSQRGSSKSNPASRVVASGPPSPSK